MKYLHAFEDKLTHSNILCTAGNAFVNNLAPLIVFLSHLTSGVRRKFSRVGFIQ